MLPGRTLRLICAAIFLMPGVRVQEGAAAERVVFEDDFEHYDPSQLAKGPPDHWAMWGRQVDKIPRNYTIDVGHAHSGRAAFRYVLPENSQGYPVLHPQHAVRPRRGYQYTLSFWIRSDRKTKVMFGVSLYQTIRPNYRPAPSPALRSVEVGPKWQRLEVTFREGLHFFVRGDSPHMLIVYRPDFRQRHRRATTFWIDDVRVVEKNNPDGFRLVNPADLAVPPLQHALREGNAVRLTVDATRRLRPVRRQIAGVSFWRLYHPRRGPFDEQGRYVLASGMERAIRQLHLPMTRIYGVADEPGFPASQGPRPWTVEEAVDRAAELCRRNQIPTAWTVLELEDHYASRTLSPETWARAVRIAKAKRYGFRHWEISNEPYANHPGKAFATADDYLEHVLSVSRAIRQADPEAKIGMAVSVTKPLWCSYLLQKAQGAYDFVVPHFYTFPRTPIHKADFSTIVLTENAKVLERLLELRSLIRKVNGDREVIVLDTEWGLHCRGPRGEKPGLVTRAGNIWAAVHDGVRMIYYAREDLVSGASAWSMLSNRRSVPGLKFLFTFAPDQRSVRYWMHYHFNRFLGDTVVSVSGTSPFHRAAGDDRAPAVPVAPAVATLGEDDSVLYLIVANGRWADRLPCEVSVRGFTPRAAYGVVVSDFRPNAADAHPLLEKKADAVRPLHVTLSGGQLRLDLPAHSVVFVRMDGSVQP